MLLRLLDKLNSLFSSKLFIVDIYVGKTIVSSVTLKAASRKAAVRAAKAMVRLRVSGYLARPHDYFGAKASRR